MKSNTLNILKINTFRIIFILYSIIILLPLLWLLMSSFKTTGEFFQDIWALPARLVWENYMMAYKRAQMNVYISNSFTITIIAVCINIFLSAMLSYTLARFVFFGKDLIQKLFLIGLLIPVILTIIPYFLLVRRIGLFNTRLSIILIYIVQSMPFSVFILTAFFKTLPRELEQSAMIDGCSYFKTYFYIMLPLARSGIFTAIIFNFLQYWSDYLFPLALLADNNKKTISLGIMELATGQMLKMEYSVLFAACIISIIPVIIVYIIFQKRLIAGLTGGGLKG